MNKVKKSLEMIFRKNKNELIENWIFGERLKEILLELKMLPSEFKIQFGDDMINRIMTFSKVENSYELCVSSLKFLLKYEGNNNIPKIIILIHTDLKNILVKLIIDSKIRNKSDALDLLSKTMDTNLSFLIDEFFYKYKKRVDLNLEHMKILEESTVMSKTDTIGNLTFASDSFCDLVGYSKEELLGSKHSIIRHPDTPDQLYKNMWETLQNGEIWKGRFKNLSKDGRTLIVNSKIIPKYSKDEEIVGYVAIRTDITDKEIARIDSLTGLANRLKFEEKISIKIDEYLIHNKKHTLAVIDIDKFKLINDNYGHLIGDNVLKEFVNIIKTQIRKDDIFARWGGEEFVLVLSIGNFDLTLRKIIDIKNSISNHVFKDVEKVTASFGVIEISDDYLTVNKLFEKADECLYVAKNSGRNKIYYIDPETNKIEEAV